MRFSIIIATLNRFKEPLSMIDSLTNQTFKDFEVLLIDQNDEDILIDELKKYDKTLSIKHIRTKIKGASNARNTGIKYAIGELLAFPDDDCEYHKTYLEDINNYFNNYDVDGIVTSTRDESNGKGISVLLSSKPQEIHKKLLLKRVL